MVTSYMRFISGNQTRPLAVELPGDGAVIVQQRFQPVLNPTVVLGSIISKLISVIGNPAVAITALQEARSRRNPSLLKGL